MRAARVGEKRAKPFEHGKGNFMPPSKLVPRHGESLAAEAVPECDGSVVRQYRIVRSVTLKNRQPFSSGPSRFPFLFRDEASRKNNQSCKGAGGSKHRVARQHGSLRKSAEKDLIRGKPVLPVEFIQHGEQVLAGGFQPLGNDAEVAPTAACRVTSESVHVQHPPRSPVRKATG